MIRVVLAALCAIALYQGAPVPTIQEVVRNAPERGMLGVMRRDGIIVPFAAFNGDSWSKPWPVVARGLELPVNLGAVPADWFGGKPVSGWTVAIGDQQQKPVTILSPAIYRSGCEPHIGLRTDYASADAPAPPATDPFPKDGLAVTEGIDVLPIARVSLLSPAATRLVEALTSDFNEAEDKAVGLVRGKAGWRHPVEEKARHARPIKIEAWYRAPMDQPGWSLSYIEAVRSYDPGPADDSCGLDSYFSGWVQHDERRPDVLKSELSARITYCDRNNVLYMLPLGRIHVKNRQFWVFQSSGWDQEWYRVVRVAPSRIEFVAEVFGGGKQGCSY